MLDRVRGVDSRVNGVVQAGIITYESALLVREAALESFKQINWRAGDDYVTDSELITGSVDVTRHLLIPTSLPLTNGVTPTVTASVVTASTLPHTTAPTPTPTVVEVPRKESWWHKLKHGSGHNGGTGQVVSSPIVPKHKSLKQQRAADLQQAATVLTTLISDS